MVSLKLREREILLNELKGIVSKAATMLDDSDYNYIIDSGLAVLDENLYNPREAIITQEFLVTEQGHYFADVTDLKIDEICNVYYSPVMNNEVLSDAVLGVGLMPFLSSVWGFSYIENLSYYLVMQGNLNSINRKLADADDYQLWPLNKEGKQLLQIRRNPELFWLEYLPHLPPEADQWYLFEHEYRFLIEYCRCEAFLRNAENLMSANVLGFGKEANEQLSYWDKKKEKLLTDFTNKRIITYIA